MSAQRLTTPELHWAAGFLDGEGSFGFRMSPRKNGSTIGSLTVAAKQVYLPSLEKLQRLFGGGISGYTRYTGHSINSWALSSARAAAVMMTLYVLLSPYRQGQIRSALSQWRAYKGRSLRANMWEKH